MSDERLQRGKEIRSEVLGAEHLERSLAQASEFTKPLQELVTEYCWGVVWARPGLGRKERSLVNLAMLTALNRPHELAVHVRGAVNNGCTVSEIQEVLLQAAVYCGVPAANRAYYSAPTPSGGSSIVQALAKRLSIGGDGAADFPVTSSSWRSASGCASATASWVAACIFASSSIPVHMHRCGKDPCRLNCSCRKSSAPDPETPAR